MPAAPEEIAPARPAADAPAENGRPPQLAKGIELLGRYEDSGFKEAPFLVRRADGQVVQLPELLYLVAEEADGRQDYDAIAARVSERFGRGLSPDNVRMLVEEKLRPLGVLADANGRSPELQKLDPLLALKLRTAVVPPGLVRAIAALFSPLFFPPIVLAVLGGLVALDVWLFGIHGVAQSARELAYKPVYLLMLLGLVALSAAFHEAGHAAACRYGGATPGAMGVGIYIVWPAFYTDVTDAYRLGRGGRLRTDLGGIYFNAIFALGTYAAYFATGFEPLLAVIVLQHLEVVHQLLPFLRLDGYYIVSDLTGVPDMFSRIKPTLKSLIPWRETDDRVKELKPWARSAVTLYVLALVPIVAFLFGTMLVSLPRLLATVWDSLWLQVDTARDAFSAGNAATGALSSFQTLLLVMPVAGITMTFGRFGKRLGSSAWAITSGMPVLRGLVLLVATGAAAATAFVLLPNGDYAPIQPGERGTVQGSVQSFSEIPSGRPGLPPKRERELGKIVTERERRQLGLDPAPVIDEQPLEEPLPTETTDTTVTTDTVLTETDPTLTETVDTTTTTTATTTTTETVVTETVIP